MAPGKVIGTEVGVILLVGDRVVGNRQNRRWVGWLALEAVIFKGIIANLPGGAFLCQKVMDLKYGDSLIFATIRAFRGIIFRAVVNRDALPRLDAAPKPESQMWRRKTDDGNYPQVQRDQPDRR